MPDLDKLERLVTLACRERWQTGSRVRSCPLQVEEQLASVSGFRRTGVSPVIPNPEPEPLSQHDEAQGAEKHVQVISLLTQLYHLHIQLPACEAHKARGCADNMA